MWRRCIYVVVGRGESYCPFFSKGIETNGHDCRRRCLSPRAVLRSVSFRSSVYLFTRGIDKCERREGEREGKFRDSLFASCAGVEDKNGFPILSIFHFLRAIPFFLFSKSDEQDIKGSSEIFLFFLGNLFKSIFFLRFDEEFYKYIYIYMYFKNRY